MNKTNTPDVKEVLTIGQLYALRTLLDAISAGVLVAANDIHQGQRKEIGRELAFMDAVLKMTMDMHKLPSCQGSVHFQRSHGGNQS